MSSRRVWLLTFTDGTQETVMGYDARLHDGVLTIDRNHTTAYFRDSKSWPLANLRSWEGGEHA